MFENIIKFFNKTKKKDEKKENANSKNAAKERLHLVLMQDRANVSADFLELMKQEIIDVIKKYIEVDENAIDVRLTNKENEDGTNGAPALYANIPIVSIKNEARKVNKKQEEPEKQEKQSEKQEPDQKEAEPAVEQPEKEEDVQEEGVQEEETQPKQEETPAKDTAEEVKQN